MQYTYDIVNSGQLFIHTLQSVLNFVSPEWLFGESENMDKSKCIHEQKRLGTN